MTESSDLKGHCLCGGVTFTVKAKSHDVAVCHCGMCRRWAGGPLFFVEAVGAPAFTGRDNIAIYKSSEWGERGFCRTCGTSLFWKLAGEDRYTFAAGTLDDQGVLHLATEIFIEDKPDYYAFANDTVKLTGEDAMADFIPASSKTE